MTKITNIKVVSLNILKTRTSFRGSALSSMVSTFGANHMGRGSNPTNRLLGRWLNGRKPSWPITPTSPEVVGSSSGTSHYCPDVPHTISNSGLSGSRQWTHLRVPFFTYPKKKKELLLERTKIISVAKWLDIKKVFLFFFFCMNVVIKSLSRIVGDPNGTRRLVSVGSGWKLLSWMNLLCPPKKLAPRRRIRAHNCFLSTVPPGSQLLKLLLSLGVVLLCGRYFSLVSKFNHEFGSNMSFYGCSWQLINVERSEYCNPFGYMTGINVKLSPVYKIPLYYLSWRVPF
jgi:hypothetical protein